jgi:hypothetical protein
MLLRYYQRLLDTCIPYVIAREAVRPSLDLRPFRLEVTEDCLFDPMRAASGPFIDLVKRLDDATYGPLALSMPSWVLYDCAVMPGVVFGFGRPAPTVEPWVKTALQVPDDYEGLVPMSILIAVPRVDRQSVLVYTLCSINQVAAGAAPEGLWRLTLAAGTRALGCEQMMATCQWRSPQLGLFAGMGPLELVTAWTPAHDNPTTCTFTVGTNRSARERLLRGDLTGPEGIHRYLDADDHDAMQALQSEIEGGLRIAIAGPAETRGSETRIPLQIREGEDTYATDREDIGFTRRFSG